MLFRSARLNRRPVFDRDASLCESGASVQKSVFEHSPAPIRNFQINCADGRNNDERDLVPRSEHSRIVCTDLPTMSTTEAGRTYISRHAPCLQYRRSERFGPHPQLCRPSAQTVQQAAHPRSLTDRMDFVVLEQRAHHAVAQHRGWNIQRLQLECSQSGLAAHTGASQSARRRVHKRGGGLTSTLGDRASTV